MAFEVGSAIPAQNNPMVVSEGSDVKQLEKRIAALEVQVQELPDKIVSRILQVLHQNENQYAEQACLAVLPRTSKQNSTD